MASAGKHFLDMSRWRPAEWVLFALASLMFISLFLPWIKRTATFDPDAIPLAESFAEETENPFSLSELVLPRAGQLEVAMDQFLRGRNVFSIFTDLRRSESDHNESHFFVGHLLGKGNFAEKAYLFLLFPIMTIITALVALAKPKGLRLAAYIGAGLFILYLAARLALLFTDSQRDFVGIALGPGVWVWLYSTLLLCLWLVLRATFPKSKFF